MKFLALVVSSIFLMLVGSLRSVRPILGKAFRLNRASQPLGEYAAQLHSSNTLFASVTSETLPRVEAIAHPSYQEVESFTIKEYGLNGVLYKHTKSGAQIMSIQAPDENKVFGITFRTPPKDSSGVPHVLEHSVLCGSAKFPVKEPFVDLLKGSLQNFLNAFTYPDRTCYPVASTNTKDFYNLVHVYLDAVLHPRAVHDPQVLQQEGWHYELEAPDGPLSVKGVVFNEMKGVYSSPDALMGRATQQALFPDNTYGVDSGGNPSLLTKPGSEAGIARLSFEQFKAFHASYYHPANSRIFFYGDDDVRARLDLLDEYLQGFQAIPVESRVVPQTKFPEPRSIEVGFPVTPGTEPKHMLTVNWLLNEEALSAKDMLAWGVLDYLLLGTSSSPLRKALTESGLGESVCGGGLSDELLQATFSIGLKGVAAPDVDQVEQLVLHTLEQLANEGFEEAAVEAALNTFEFRLREFNTGSFPKGLSVMLGMMSQWIYDRDPVQGVAFEAPLQALKEELAAGKPVFQQLVHNYLVQNQHRVRVEMKPDAEMEARRVEAETAWLAQVKASMTAEELREVQEVAARLKEAQQAPDSPEARATLPKLELSDIDPQNQELPIQVSHSESHGMDATLITHHLESSGILYADVAFDYSSIDLEDIELLPLFSRMLLETGTKRRDLTELSRRIGAHTGGISLSYHNDIRAGETGIIPQPDDAILFMLIQGKAVSDKVPMLFELFAEVLLEARLDNQQRAVEMLKESKARKEASILSSGHSYAATRLAGRSSFLGYLNECTGGLTSVRRAESLLKQATDDWPTLSARLEKMRRQIVRTGKDALIINLTGNQQLLDEVLPSVQDFASTVAAASEQEGERDHRQSIVARWKEQKKLLPMQNEGFAIPSQVNYVVKGGSILQPGDEVKGSYSVVTRSLGTGYLWDSVRVVGGAYGGFARFSQSTGRFVYISYRDPNCIDTLRTYDRTSQVLSEAEVSSEEILQAVIGSVGDLDAPMTAQQKGLSSLAQFLAGETAEARQQWRTQILSTDAADFKRFAAMLGKLREEGTVAVFGSQQALEEANLQLPEEKRLVIEQALPSKD